jgi:hypothetical protein
VKPGPLAAAVAEQIASNTSASGHEASFAAHRARLTKEILERTPTGGRGRLCLLGAGNANDVDLEALAMRFAEVHLVDLDPDAVGRAIARVAPPLRAPLVAHAPLDASGLFDRLESWAANPPALGDIDGIVAGAVARVTGALPGPFDVVVSCSLLTQLQLVLVQVLGDASPIFDGIRTALNRAHMRALGGLLPPGGVALLVTDLTTSALYPPLVHVDEGADLAKLMGDLIAAGHIIYAANPGPLTSEMRRDPALKQAFEVRSPIGPWIWTNGPAQSLLVYAIEIRRRA